MRKLIIVALVLVVIGIGVSFLLIPDKSEIASSNARDVATVAQGNIDVEAEYNQGRRTFPIVSGLADKRVNEGNRPAAVALLEEYTKASPNDAEGHKKLAEQYQLSNRQADFNREIEVVANLAPTEDNLRVLSYIYNADKNYPKQLEVLKKILEVTGGNKPEAFQDVATMQVVTGDKDGALATLDQLKAKHPDFQSYTVTRLRVSILAEKGKTDEAFAIAKQWVDRPIPAMNTPANVPPAATPKATITSVVTTPSGQLAKELADLANIMHYSGHADKAVELVEPHIVLLPESTELVLAYVNANITLGRDEHAYQILTQIDTAGKMSPELYLPYLQLAIKRQDTPAAEGIANKLDVNTFNEEQALNIIEVARVNNAPTVLDILLNRFNQPPGIESKPVLSAVIAIMKKDKEQDNKINTALSTQLSSLQRLRLAEACARAGKTACFDTIVKQYPPMDQMSNQQVGEYASLFIIANRPAEIIDGVTLLAVKPNAHPDVQDAQRRLACAAGREDIMRPWLEANANTAPVIKLQEYFYIAHDHKQYKISTDIAERMYARDPSPMSRDLMVTAYVSSDQYAKALPFLREQIKQEGTDDSLYITALSKAARKDKAARKELTDYAEASLRANKGNDKAQMNYAYALLSNGRKDAAMPFVNQYAKERGGEWKKMQAQLSLKPGKGGKVAKKLTREEMIAMANNPKMSDDNKRQMAFGLLNMGYKADATHIFEQIASDKPADSKEVKDLLYVWGGKLNGDQIAWLQQRAANANGYERERWSELINVYGDDYSILQYVSATPDALYNRPLRQKYFRVLATNGGKQAFDGNMRGWVSQTTDVPALVDYAQTAQLFGYNDAANSTYQRILQLDPSNEAALNQMTMVTMSKGNYSAAGQYVDRYLNSQAMKPTPETSPALAHFYKAQLLRHNGDVAGARNEFAAVVQTTPVTIDTSPDALSRLYISEFHIGQHDQAKAGFEQLLAQYPNDKALLADYMGVLIEYKYFEDATRVANQYDKNSPYYGRGAALTGNSEHVAGVEQLSGGREMRISFNQPIEADSPFNEAHVKQLAWVENSNVGYDNVTISAKPGYVIRYTPTTGEQFAVVAAPVEEVSPQLAADRAQDLRLQLLYAQIEMNTGQTDRAKQRLATLQRYYPNDPQLITARAGMEGMSGNTGKASELLRQAQALEPANEDISRQLAMMHRTSSGNLVKLDHEYRSLGPNDEQITTLSGVVKIGDRTEVGANIKNDFMNTKDIRRPEDGKIGDYDTSREQAELFLAQYFEGGDRGQVSLFANNATMGVGAYYAFNNQLGRTQLMAEYQKPYWDFVEAVYDHTTRDRIGLTHTSLINPTLSMGVETSFNRYNIEIEDDVAQSYLLRLSFIQRLNETGPYVAVGYGFDGEYLMGDPDTNTTGFGTYDLLPVVSREVHFFSGILGFDMTPSTHLLFVGGWAFDRMNSTNGPVAEGNLRQDITDQFEAGLRAHYGFESNDTNNDMTTVGGYLMYKF